MIYIFFTSMYKKEISYYIFCRTLRLIVAILLQTRANLKIWISWTAHGAMGRSIFREHEIANAKKKGC